MALSRVFPLTRLRHVAGASVVAATYSLAVVVSQVARVAVGLDSSAFGYGVSYPVAVAQVAAVAAVAAAERATRAATGMRPIGTS
jgi:hypothetical protein